MIFLDFKLKIIKDSMMKIRGNIVNVISKRIFSGEITISNGKIESIQEVNDSFNTYIIPGLIDSHVHVESSMLTPSEFAAAAVVHGTTATVSDPHEIANVLGKKGVEYMIENGSKVPFKFYFGVPSCVPATGFETSGAELNADDIKELFENYDLKYLSEMMNFPGVIYDDDEVHRKLQVAKDLKKRIDGHAPGLKGSEANKYASAGITTDHECFTIEEALEKINFGIKILIREGSAAKNFHALHSLLNSHPDSCMICSDDKHPDDLVNGHINAVIKKGIENGHDIYNLLRAATLNPIEHYGLENGLLREGDPADIVIIDNLENFKVLKTYINGELVAEDGQSFIEKPKVQAINHFNCSPKSVDDFKIEGDSSKVNVIEVIDGELITNKVEANAKLQDGNLESNVENDILKIAVINRYNDGEPALGFIKNIGIKQGAIASSVAHDSHNIIAVGTNDEELKNAVNTIIENKGGIAVVKGDEKYVLPLPVAGIMAVDDAETVAMKYSELDKKAKELGSQLKAPFMTLSFMALLVIPELKLSDKGLFDGKDFKFVKLTA
jgi:adenine deaminase